MYSHPELGSDPPIGSDQESGRDKEYEETIQAIEIWCTRPIPRATTS